MMNKKKQGTYLQVSLKGCALIAAVETGLLPEIERDGETGYDNELFDRFWKMYNDLSQERQKPLCKKSKDRA